MLRFLNKFEFFRYASACNQRLFAGKGFNGYGWFCLMSYILFIGSLFIGIMSQNFMALSVCFISAVTWGVSVGVAMDRNTKPNLSALLPISGRRKCVYDYLVVLYLTLLCLLVIAAVILLVFLLVFIIVQIVYSVSGGNMEDTEEFVQNYAGIQGGLFAVIYFIIFYSGGILGGYIKNRTYRLAYLFAFIIMLFSGMAFTSLPAYKALSNVSAAGSEVLKVVTPFEEACYSYMQIPWLCIALWGAVAVLLFVLSVYAAWKYHKHKNY